MATEGEYQQRLGQFAALLRTIVMNLGDHASADLIETAVRQIDSQLAAWEHADATQPAPFDMGFSQLVGLGSSPVGTVRDAFMPQALPPFDVGQTVSAQRITAVGDIYYVYQHERAGIFDVMEMLAMQFDEGALGLAAGDGALRLYRYQRRELLRASRAQRSSLYDRLFGTGVADGLESSVDIFLARFARAVTELLLRRVDLSPSSSVAEDIAAGWFLTRARAAGLDLRTAVAARALGNSIIMSVELMQTLRDAFAVLESDDMKTIFGGENGWDVMEALRSKQERVLPPLAAHNRQAAAGRALFRWLAEPHILDTDADQLSNLFMEIAEPAQQWIACTAAT